MPLRRRTQVWPAALVRERRKRYGKVFDVAGTLELNLDRYPTTPAMLTFLKSLIYAAEDNPAGSWQPAYTGALKHAADIVQGASNPVEALATLHGYQNFVATREQALH